MVPWAAISSQSAEDVSGKLFRRRFTHAANAGADAASGCGDFFVAGSGDAFLEVDEAGSGEDGMGVGVDEAGEDDLAAAVDFFGVLCEWRSSSVVPTAAILPSSMRTAPSSMMPRSASAGRGADRLCRATSGVARRG